MTALSPGIQVPGRGRARRPDGRPAVAPSPALQGSLFDCADEVAFGTLGKSVQRRPLLRGAWLDVRRAWVTGSVLLFERLRTSAAWQAEQRQMYDRVVDVPRLSCHLAADDDWPDPFLRDLQAALNSHYAHQDPFLTCGMAYYRDGRDSVAWHGDTIGRGATQDVMVAIVSVGEPRVFMLRPRGGGESIRYEIGHGDLLVMGGSAQRTWEHAVPKTVRPVGPRISIQFRPRQVA